MQPRKTGILLVLAVWVCATLACSAANNLFPDPESMESTAAAVLTEEGDQPRATEAPEAEPTRRPTKKTPTPEVEVTVEVTIDGPGDIPDFGTDAVPEDIPLIEDDPVNLFASGQVVAYQTERDFADVLVFYKEQMPENGWELTDEITAGPTAILTYAKGDQMAIVTFTEDGGITSVSIVIQDK